jgi:hypothetical protein
MALRRRGGGGCYEKGPRHGEPHRSIEEDMERNYGGRKVVEELEELAELTGNQLSTRFGGTDLLN